MKPQTTRTITPRICIIGMSISNLVGLANHSGRYPGDLSGGERQRVAIARALVLNPAAVLFDEPLSNLDVPLKRELLALLRELLRARRAAAIYVTHEPREATALAARIAAMEDGRIVQTGSIAALRGALRGAPATEFVRTFVEETRQP